MNCRHCENAGCIHCRDERRERDIQSRLLARRMSNQERARLGMFTRGWHPTREDERRAARIGANRERGARFLTGSTWAPLNKIS